MTSKEFLKIIYDWIDQILNIEQTFNIKIIRSNQTFPVPVKKYICIHQPVPYSKIGQGVNFYSDNQGTVNLISEYEALIRIEGIGDDDGMLKYLLNSVIRQDIQDYFFEKKISYLRCESILQNNEIIENNWTIRTFIDLFFLIKDEYNYKPGYIGKVEVNNQIIGG